jgi:hypothetical protein
MFLITLSLVHAFALDVRQFSILLVVASLLLYLRLMAVRMFLALLRSTLVVVHTGFWSLISYVIFQCNAFTLLAQSRHSLFLAFALG